MKLLVCSFFLVETAFSKSYLGGTSAHSYSDSGFKGLVYLGGEGLYDLMTEFYLPYVFLLLLLASYILDILAKKIEAFRSSRTVRLFCYGLWTLYFSFSLLFFRLTERVDTFRDEEPMSNRNLQFLSRGYKVLGIELLILFIISSLVFYFQYRRKLLDE